LKLLPFWDPLRGDPRFEKIVALACAKSELTRNGIEADFARVLSC